MALHHLSTVNFHLAHGCYACTLVLQYASSVSSHLYHALLCSTQHTCVLTWSARCLQTNQAQKQRRRTYRAHGRINPYMCSPCHIELTLIERDSGVKAAVEEKQPRKLSKKAAAKKLRSGTASRSV